MTDLLFYGTSTLMELQLRSMAGDATITRVSTETEFFSVLFQERPFCIVIGDPGPRDPLSLLHCLKDIGNFNRIPLLYYGENEWSDIFPGISCFDFSPESAEAMTGMLTRILKESGEPQAAGRKAWPIPEDLTKWEDLSAAVEKRARRRMEAELIENDVETAFRALPTVHSDIQSSLVEIGETFCRITTADFVYLAFSGCNILKNHFHVHRRPISESAESCGDSEESPVSEELLVELTKRLAEKFIDSQDPQPSVSFTSRTLGIDGAGKSEMVIQTEIAMQPDADIEAFLIAGYFAAKEDPRRRIPEPILEVIQKSIPSVISDLRQMYTARNTSGLTYRAFSQFLPPKIIDDLLLKQTERALMTGEKRSIVVLFSHIRSFDRIAEENSAETVVDFLNAHFSRMVRIIQSHGGSIDKFIGDAIFAIFGAPVSYVDNARRAAEAALEMIRNYRETDVSAVNLPEEGFTIGVGLNEGEAIIGNIGCSDKFDYTAIGDTVNLAARLESLCKYYRQDILISDSMYQRLKNDNFCRSIDLAKVKGKSTATAIYSLIVNPDEYSPQWRERYKRGVTMYRLGNWHTASDYFEAAQKIRPDDVVCRILLDRCEEYQAEPPENWDGSVALDFK